MTKAANLAAFGSDVITPEGDAPVYSCRAWVNFNGTGTVSIRKSGNISSITDRGQGLYTLNLTNALPDIDFALAGYANEGDSYSGDVVAMDGGRSSRTTSAIPIRLWEISNSGAYDAFEMHVVIFR